MAVEPPPAEGVAAGLLAPRWVGWFWLVGGCLWIFDVHAHSTTYVYLIYKTPHTCIPKHPTTQRGGDRAGVGQAAAGEAQRPLQGQDQVGASISSRLSVLC